MKRYFTRDRVGEWAGGLITAIVLALIFATCLFISTSDRGTVYLNDGTVVNCDHLSQEDGFVRCDDVTYSQAVVDHFTWNS